MWLWILLIVLFVAVLVFLLLNFLGIVQMPSLGMSLPWSRSPPAEDQEQTELENLQQEKAVLTADLAQLSSRLQDKDAQIASLESEIQGLRSELDKIALQQENITSMASVYGKMDPQAAANILEKNAR